MGIFSRFNDIINSNLNAMLDKAENPEKIIRLVVQEMEDTLVEVRSEAARAIADQKKQQRKIERLESEADDWAAKARLAMDKDREDLARAALAEKHACTRSAEVLSQDLDALDEHLAKLHDDIARLQEKLDDARVRQKAILLKTKAVGNRLKTQAALHDSRIDDAMLNFDRMEHRIDKMEGHLEAWEIGRKPELAEQFAELEVAEDIEKELDELRQQGKGEK